MGHGSTSGFGYFFLGAHYPLLFHYLPVRVRLQCQPVLPHEQTTCIGHFSSAYECVLLFHPLPSFPRNTRPRMAFSPPTSFNIKASLNVSLQLVLQWQSRDIRLQVTHAHTFLCRTATKHTKLFPPLVSHEATIVLHHSVMRKTQFLLKIFHWLAMKQAHFLCW